jgi:hypothetical protein
MTVHKIFVWSIQHTGTFFASHTIASAYPSDQQLRIGSLYEKHKKLGHTRYVTDQPIELSDFVKPSACIEEDWMDQAITTVCTPENIAGKKIIVGHEHHHKAKSWMIKSAAKFKPKVPIIVPMRDPLLSLHSKLWRADEEHHNKNWEREKTRQHRLNSWVERYIELLSLPKGHVFILPIDAEQSRTAAGRIELISKMFKHCGVPFNDSAQAAVKAWAPQNRTFKLITRKEGDDPKPRWEKFKEQYLARNVNHTKKFMGLEFDLLHKEAQLKDLLFKIGYRDLLWW